MSTEHQVTEWGHPNEMVRTCHGTIRYSSWLYAECERWANKWRRAYVRENNEGLVAMFTEDTEMRPVEGNDPKPNL